MHLEEYKSKKGGFIPLKDWINKQIRKLPGIRRPDPEVERLKRQHFWALTPRNKNLNLNIGTYFTAAKMPWIRVCRRVITNRVLGLGYIINNPSETEAIQSTTHYLDNLMKNPMGISAKTFYEEYILQTWDSFLITGDSFTRVHYDEVFDNVMNGLEFIPMEWMTYHEDTSQWGLKYDDVRFENDEIIHFAEPSKRGSVWGDALIDALAEYLALQVYGLKFNRNVFEHDGINPNGVLKYDVNMDPDDVRAEVERIEKDKKENPNGTLIIHGGEYIQTNNSNKEMQYIELENLIRDLTLSVYGVTPAEAGVIESGNIGGGTGDSQRATIKNNLTGWLKLYEGAHNKVFGHNSFEELFQFEEIDLEDKQKRAEIEDKQLRNGTLFINEVRSGYGLEPVDWGNVPMNYSQFALASNPENLKEVDAITPSTEVKALKKALLMERLNKEY